MGAGPVRWMAAAAGALGLAGLAAGQGVSATPARAAAPQPQPVRPAAEGSTREELGIDRSPPLLREGAFVSSARGVLAKGRSGRWYVVFDRDARGRQMPPMVVLPSANLGAMERIAARMNGDDAAKARILVTGQVMAYQGHNYLLPTAPPILETSIAPAETAKARNAAAEETPAAETDGGKDGAAAAGEKAAGAEAAKKDEPSIEQIIGELDRSLGTRRATNPGGAPGAAKSGAGSGNAADERESQASETTVSTARVRPAGFMTARRGRVVRTGGGEATFVVDAGTAGEVAEPPMTLLPCTNLSMIESLAERMGESATFTISGQVTVYQGRNFLLPTTCTVNRSSNHVIPNQ